MFAVCELKQPQKFPKQLGLSVYNTLIYASPGLCINQTGKEGGGANFFVCESQLPVNCLIGGEGKSPMTITELGMHYYLLLDVFLLNVFMLRKAVNPLSLLRRPSLLTLNRNVDSDFTVPVVSKGGLMLVLMVVNLNFGLLFLPSAV